MKSLQIINSLHISCHIDTLEFFGYFIFTLNPRGLDRRFGSTNTTVERKMRVKTFLSSN